MTSHRRNIAIGAAVVIAAIGTYAFIEYGSDDTADFTGPKEWVGISAEFALPDRYDQTGLLTVSADGNTTLAGEYPNAWRPAMERLGRGFAFPSGDRIVVVDEELREIWHTDLGQSPRLSGSTSSPDGTEAAFAFNAGVYDDGEIRSLLVRISSSGETAIKHVRGYLAGLTICRSGEVQWLTTPYKAEPSTVRMVRWSDDGGVQAGREYETGSAMAKTQSPIVCGEEPEDDRGYAIAFSESREDYRILKISRDGGSDPESVGMVPALSGDLQSKSWGKSDGAIYWLTGEGKLNFVDVTGNPRSGVIELPLGGDTAVTATFEGNAAYIVHHPTDDRSVRRISEFDLSSGACKGDTLELTDWKYQSLMAKLMPDEASFITITSILPTDSAHTVQCG